MISHHEFELASILSFPSMEYRVGNNMKAEAAMPATTSTIAYAKRENDILMSLEDTRQMVYIKPQMREPGMK